MLPQSMQGPPAGLRASASMPLYCQSSPVALAGSVRWYLARQSLKCDMSACCLQHVSSQNSTLSTYEISSETASRTSHGRVIRHLTGAPAALLRCRKAPSKSDHAPSIFISCSHMSQGEDEDFWAPFDVQADSATSNHVTDTKTVRELALGSASLTLHMVTQVVLCAG